MTKTHKRRVLIGSCALLALGVGVPSALLYSGVIWFNRPSLAQYPVRGVDVSHYQGQIDWDVLCAQDDLTFAYIKATEGSGSQDECFSYNWDAAMATDLCVGAYHFFSFDSPGQTQADNFIATVPRSERAMPPVIDLEYYGDKAQNPPAAEAVSAILTPLIERLTAHYGAAPVIYTTRGCYERYLASEHSDCPIWIRDVLDVPQESDWTFWQYSNRKKLRGYDGEEPFIDMNVYRGSRAEFFREFFPEQSLRGATGYGTNEADRPL